MGDNQRSKLFALLVIGLLSVCAISGAVIAYQMVRIRPHHSPQEQSEDKQAYQVNFWIKDDYKESGQCSYGKPDIAEQNGLLRLTFHFPDGTQVGFANVTRYAMNPNDDCKKMIESVFPTKSK